MDGWSLTMENAFSSRKVTLIPHSQISLRREQAKQAGRPSSHFRFRFRQLRQPVRDLVFFFGGKWAEWGLPAAEEHRSESSVMNGDGGRDLAMM